MSSLSVFPDRISSVCVTSTFRTVHIVPRGNLVLQASFDELPGVGAVLHVLVVDAHQRAVRLPERVECELFLGRIQLFCESFEFSYTVTTVAIAQRAALLPKTPPPRGPAPVAKYWSL